MRDLKLRVLAMVVLVFGGVASAEDTRIAGDPYLEAVRRFGDNVLRHGRDVYGPKHTPLFVDGLNVDTREPVCWQWQDEKPWVLSNLASQQSLLRTLVGLSQLTGDPKYQEAAVEAVGYALEQLRYGREHHGGLLAWGGHMAYDATNDTITGEPNGEGRTHELKSHYPYYELMWEVDPERTKTLIESIWNAHVVDWSNLDFNRHAKPKPAGRLWGEPYEGGDVFFWGEGLTFLNTGSDLVYAAAMASKLSGDPAPLVWAKRLAHRYVETRNPKTGIGGFQFSQSKTAWCNGPEILGDRAQYQFGDFFPGHFVVEGTLFMPYGSPWAGCQICQLVVGEKLGENGAELTEWAREELSAWGRSAYRAEDNSFIPMLTDGTSMEGFVCQKDGYFGPKGRVLKAIGAGASEFWAYSLAYRLTQDEFMWEMARNIARGLDLGDIGDPSGQSPRLKRPISSSDPITLLAFLELHGATGREDYLQQAVRIGDNLLQETFHQGFFVDSPRHLFAKFDRTEPLALLRLAAVIRGKPDSVPTYFGGSSYFHAAYGQKEGARSYDRRIYDHSIYQRQRTD